MEKIIRTTLTIGRIFQASVGLTGAGFGIVNAIRCFNADCEIPGTLMLLLAIVCFRFIAVPSVRSLHNNLITR
ncbi:MULTISPECIES: hypothetical protein [Muribaculaceae]|uniref:hypothetical protein n=1 Tax=Muribaculaceae TaxID=2005473 RepID=UPI0026498F1D|nr:MULTISPECIES: hypothetical protein [Muribaculaceae]